MKKIFFGLTIALMAVGLVIGQKEPVVKEVEVTAKMITSQPAKTDYVLDVTGGDKIYHVAAGVDYNRIRLRSGQSSVNLGDLINTSGEDLHGEDFAAGSLGAAVKAGWNLKKNVKKRTPAANAGLRSGGGPNFTCGVSVCVCHGDDDCNHLFTTDSCGPYAVCFTSGGRVTCFCSTTPH